MTDLKPLHEPTQKENLYTPNSIRTVSGRYVNVLNPDTDSILIYDIAHALSRMPRFGGHLPHFYSVAQHSMCVANLVDKQHALSALLHDASEAYLMDIPSPIKALLPNYKEIENGLMEVISKKFGFEWPMPDEVKEADKKRLEWEWDNLMLKGQNFTLPSETVKNLFFNRFIDFNIQ